MTTFSRPLYQVSSAVRRRAVLSAVLILGIALLIIPFRIWYRTPAPRVPLLVHAADAMESRPIAARLTGGFPYRKLRSHTRGGHETSADSARMAGVAENVSAQTPRQSGPEAAHVAGLSSLLINKPNLAVTTLEEALRLETKDLDLSSAIVHSRNADILSDLAAAYLARGSTPGTLDDLSALNAVERAWQLARKPEIAWNRGLALSLTSSRENAAAAWRDYIAIDPASDWTVEAQQRLAAVLSDSPASRDAVTHAIDKALSRSNDDDLLRAVSLGPAYARSIAEDVLLPAWGAGDDAALDRAARLGNAVAQISGDYVAFDTAQRIVAISATRDQALRTSFAAYGQGRKALALHHYDDARRLLTTAQDVMRSRKGIPLGGRTAVFLSSIAFYDKKPDASLAICAAVAGRNDVKRYPSITAQCAWNDGMVETGRFRFGIARAAFERARAAFEQMRDPIGGAALDVRLSENYRWAGDPAGAWACLSRSLRDGASEPGYIPLSEAARTSDSAGLPFAALSFCDQAITSAERSKSPVELTDGYLARTQQWMRLERRDDARRDLDAASRSLAAISDVIAAARFKTQFAITEGTLLASSEPDRVLSEIGSAIADLQATTIRRRLAMAYTVAAKAYLAKKDAKGAEVSLNAALTEIDRERTEVNTDEDRMALIDTARQTAESLVGLLFDTGRKDAALLAADDSKALLLRDALAPGGGKGEPAQRIATLPLPPGDVAYIEYFQLDDRLLAWTVTSSGIRPHAIPIRRFQLSHRIDSLQQAMAAGEDVRSSAQELFQTVLAPVWADVAARAQLVIVSDDLLHRLSFSMLVLPSTSRYLVEERSISLVPILAWLVTREHMPGPPGPIQRAVAAAPSGGETDTGDPYPELATSELEVRAVAQQFANTSVLTRDQATPARFAAASAESDVIHFAGHAIVDERRPSHSALVMSGGALLRASEIVQWRLSRTRLVVLGG
jgi:CHAT domain-containing protein